MVPKPSSSEQRYAHEHDVGLWTFGTVRVVREWETDALKMSKAVHTSGLRNHAEVLGSLLRLRELKHAHMCSVTEVIEEAEHLHIISEKTDGGDLSDWLVRLQEENQWLHEGTVADYMRQAFIALAYSHSLGIRHQDLSPASLWLTSKLPDAKVKLADCGVAAVLDPNMVMPQRGDSPYTAPEVLDGSWRSAPSTVGPFAPDVWSLGAVAHMLLSGRPPSRQSDGKVWMPSVSLLAGNPEGDGWQGRSKLSRDFVNWLLQPALSRPTAARALQHPWLQEVAANGGALASWGTTCSNLAEVMQEIELRTLSYTLSLLLIPAVLASRDLVKLRRIFLQADVDCDGLVAVRLASRLLAEMGARAAAAAAALEVVDVYSNGVYDLCALCCAVLIAHEFPTAVPGRSGSPREIAARLLRRFYQCYGQATISMAELQRRLLNEVGHWMESTTGVDYEKLLSVIPEDCLSEEQVVRERLQEGQGRGTPLGAFLTGPTSGLHSFNAPWGDNLGELVAAVWQTAAAALRSKWGCMDV